MFGRRVADGSSARVSHSQKLLLQANGKPIVSMKRSRTPEVVRYRRHCADEYEQAQ